MLFTDEPQIVLIADVYDTRVLYVRIPGFTPGKEKSRLILYDMGRNDEFQHVSSWRGIFLPFSSPIIYGITACHVEEEKNP